MSYRELNPIDDGDQGPIFRLRLRDGAGYRDLSGAAVVCYVTDSAGTNIASRPGVVISPKTDGYVDVLMRGKETDWDGAGKELFLVPRVYYAQAPDGTAATNLLVNPSFDTGAGTVADSWTQSGTLDTMAYSLKQDDPAPPVIFGKAQQSYNPAGSTSTAYLIQSPTVTIAAGDVISGGVWQRARLDTGAAIAAGNKYYVRVELNAADPSASTVIAAGDSDWRFIRESTVAAAARTAASLLLVNYDAVGYDLRYDDAFLFKGKWAVFHPETYRLPVWSRPRPSKTNFTTANFIKGVGGFEQDSNADGIGDGWGRTGTGNTYVLERDPDHTNGAASLGAQKVTLSASSTEQLRILHRANHKAGETWTFKVPYKNSGALGGAPANGAFGLVLHTEEFDGTYETSALSAGNFGVASVAAYTTATCSVTLTADHSVLVLDINLKTATGGTLWLDDAILLRTA